MEQPPSDAELVAAARWGDKVAFGCLINRYRAFALRMAQSMVGDDELARDLTQEAILQAYLSLDSLRDDDRFKNWLIGIVLNVCRGYIRSQRINYLSWESLMGGAVIADFTWTTPASDPADVAEVRELHQRVMLAVETLSPKNRAAVLLYYYDSLTIAEVADMLGISANAVKGRLHKARHHLRLILRSQFDPLASEQGVKPMNSVTIADVVKHKVDDHTHWIVILLDEAKRWVLPIWIGEAEGMAISMQLLNVSTSRPMTTRFMADILKAANVQIEAVHINMLKDDVYYATVQVRGGDGTKPVDARPSDAIALALATNSPILVAEEVFANTGRPVPDTMDSTQLGHSLQTIGDELKTIFVEREKRQQEFEAMSPEAREEALAANQRRQEEVLQRIFER